MLREIDQSGETSLEEEKTIDADSCISHGDWQRPGTRYLSYMDRMSTYMDISLYQDPK